MSSSGGVQPKLLIRCAMPSSPVTFVSATRTTLCDIQSTTNTPFPVEALPPPPESIKQISATLPYSQPYNGMVGPMKSTTKFQKLKVDDSRLRKMSDLKRDREVYFRKLQQEKLETTQRRNQAATKIQSLFRGYRKRPKRNPYLPKRKPKVILTHFEIYDELCKMAADLHLEPIPGMNLEFRTKASKRQMRIENAAAFRIQRFFRMLYERSVAQVVLKNKRFERKMQAAKTITKAVRYVITKKFVKRVDIMKRERCATTIERTVRGYQARMRVKELRKQKFVDYRRNEAAIVIQRNLSSRALDDTRFANITMKTLRSFRKMVTLVANGISSIVLNEYIEHAVDDYLETLSRVLSSVTQQSEEQVLREEVEELMNEAVAEWVIDMLRQIELENQRIAAEQARFLEELGMSSEEELSRQNVSQSPVVTLAMRKDIAMESIAAEFTQEAVDAFADELSRDVLAAEKERQHEEEALQEKLCKEAAEQEERERIEQENMRLADETSRERHAAERRKEEFQSAVSTFVHGVTGAGLLTVSQILESSQVLDNNGDNYTMCLSEIDGLVSAEPSHLEDMSFDAAHVSILMDSVEPSVVLDDESATRESVHDHDHDDEKSESASQASGASASASLRSDSSTLNAATTASRAAMSVKEIAQYTAQAKHQRAVQELNPLMANIEKKLIKIRSATHLSQEEIHALLTKHSVVYSILGLMKARNLFALGAFDESKILFDAVLKIREDTLGAGHYLVGEVLFFLAEWHRANAIYDEAEALFQRANAIFAADVENYQRTEKTVHHVSVAEPAEEASVGEASETSAGQEESKSAQQLLSPADLLGSASLDESAEEESSLYTVDESQQLVDALPSPTVFKLYHRNLIAYTELLRQTGQYYKSYEQLKRVQASLLYFKQFDIVSFEVKEEFLVSLIATFVARGKYSHAVSLHQQLLDRRRVHYGLRHPKVATSMALLGQLMLLRAKYGDAANLIEESLSIRYEYYANHGLGYRPQDSLLQSAQSCNHPAIAASHALKAEGFLSLGRFAEALVEANRALTIFSSLFRKRSHGTHPALAKCLQVIGKVYNLLGEPLLAKQALDDALQILRSRFSDMHVKLLDTLSELAASFMQRGLFPVAADTLQFVLARRDTLAKMSGAEQALPVDLLVATCQRARCLVYTGGLRESKDLVKPAVQALQSILGREHPLLSHALLCFADVSKVRGSYGDARALGSLAYDVLSALHGEQHAFVCTIMRESADNMRVPGYYAEAASIANLAMDVANRLFSLPQSSVALQSSTENSLSALSSSAFGPKDNMHQGRLQLLRAVLLRDRTPLVHWQDYEENGYRPSAQFVVACDEYDEAEQMLQHAAQVFREKGGENCAYYLVALLQLGELYRLQRNFNAAERYLLAALNVVGKPCAPGGTTEDLTSHVQLPQLLQLFAKHVGALLSPQQAAGEPVKEPLPRFASEGVDTVLSRRGVLYAEALLLYCSFLLDIRQFQSASQFLSTAVLPLLGDAVGENHLMWRYARALLEVCALFAQWEEDGAFVIAIHNTIARDVDALTARGSSASVSDYSESHSIEHDASSYATVVSGMLHEMRENVAALPAVRAMAQFCASTGFSLEHVWLRRLQVVHYSFIDAVVYLSDRSTTSSSEEELFEKSRFSSISFAASAADSASGATTDDYSTASRSDSRSQSTSFFSGSQSPSLSGSLTAGSMSSQSPTVVTAESMTYAPQLSVISEGEDHTLESSAAYSAAFNDSLASSAGESVQDSQTYSPSSSQLLSVAQDLGENSLQDDQSNYDTRSYISYISHFSQGKHQESLHSPRSHFSRGDSRLDSLTPRDSPRSVVSGRSAMTSSLQRMSHVEDETVESWMSEYYSASQSQSLTNPHTASYLSGSITQGESFISKEPSQHTIEEDEERSEVSYESEDFERVDEDTLEQSQETTQRPDRRDDDEEEYEELFD